MRNKFHPLNIFWNGLKALAPVALTFSILIWMFRSIESFFEYFIIKIWGEAVYFDGLGVIVGIALVFIIGILVHAWVTRYIYHLFQSLLKKIPIVKTVYNSLYDLFMFFDKTKTSNQRAVVVNTPIGKVVGFVTKDDLSAYPKEFAGEDNLLVYVPFGYQIGGFTISMPKASVEKLDMPVEKAMSLVVTAGMASGTNK